MLLSTSILCMKTHINLQLQEYQFGYWRYIICILTILSTFIKSHCCNFWVVIGVGCRLGAQWSVCSVGWMVICVECRVDGDLCGVSGGWWSVWSVGWVVIGVECWVCAVWWSVWSIGWMVIGVECRVDGKWYALCFNFFTCVILHGLTKTKRPYWNQIFG